MHRSSSALLLLFFVSSGVGCAAKMAADDRFDPTIAPAIPQSNRCSAHARDTCKRLVPCCSESGFDGSIETCERNVAAECRRSEAEHVASGETFDPQAAGICIAGSATLHRGCLRSGTPQWEGRTPSRIVKEACARVWTGNIAIGGKCKRDSECAKAAPGVAVWCHSVPGGDYSVCTQHIPASEGEACSMSQSCGGNLVCAPAPTGGYRCVRRAAKGDACDPSVAAACLEGSTCSLTSKTCVDMLPLGAACNSAKGPFLGVLERVCAAPNECDFGTHVCTAPLPMGAPCDPALKWTMGVGCGIGNYCPADTARCAPRKPVGSACTSNDECTGHCSSGRCAHINSIANEFSCAKASGS